MQIDMAEADRCECDHVRVMRLAVAQLVEGDGSREEVAHLQADRADDLEQLLVGLRYVAGVEVEDADDASLPEHRCQKGAGPPGLDAEVLPQDPRIAAEVGHPKRLAGP